MISIDFAINSAFGSFAPIFAIFLTTQIEGGNVQVAGFATAAYWISKSFLQLPIARFLDKTDGEKDDFYALFIGYLLGSFSIFLYLFASEPFHIYLIEAFLGVSMAVAVPAWYGIFTRHIDHNHTSFEWSLESVFSVGIATALSGALGGIIATQFGFNVLFIGAGILSLIGSFFVLILSPYMIKKMPSKITLIDVKGLQR